MASRRKPREKLSAGSSGSIPLVPLPKSAWNRGASPGSSAHPAPTASDSGSDSFVEDEDTLFLQRADEKLALDHARYEKAIRGARPDLEFAKPSLLSGRAVKYNNFNHAQATPPRRRAKPGSAPTSKLRDSPSVVITPSESYNAKQGRPSSTGTDFDLAPYDDSKERFLRQLAPYSPIPRRDPVQPPRLIVTPEHSPDPSPRETPLDSSVKLTPGNLHRSPDSERRRSPLGQSPELPRSPGGGGNFGDFIEEDEHDDYLAERARMMNKKRYRGSSQTSQYMQSYRDPEYKGIKKSISTTSLADHLESLPGSVVDGEFIDDSMELLEATLLPTTIANVVAAAERSADAPGQFTQTTVRSTIHQSGGTPPSKRRNNDSLLGSTPIKPNKSKPASGTYLSPDRTGTSISPAKHTSSMPAEAGAKLRAAVQSLRGHLGTTDEDRLASIEREVEVLQHENATLVEALAALARKSKSKTSQVAKLAAGQRAAVQGQKELYAQIDELLKEKDRVEAAARVDREAMLGTLTNIAVKEKDARAKRRRAIEAGQVMSYEVKDEDFGLDTTFADLTLFEATVQRVQNGVMWLYHIVPMTQSAIFIGTRFGGSIGTYFYFLRFLFYAMLPISLLYAWLLIEHLSGGDGTNTDVRGLTAVVPALSQYSAFTSELKLRYSGTTMYAFLFAAIVSLIRLAVDNRSQKTETYLNEEASAGGKSRKLSKLSLSLFDFQAQTKVDVENSRHGIAERLRIQLADEERLQAIERRSHAAKRKLIYRRLFSFLMIIWITSVSWAVIFLVTFYQNEVISAFEWTGFLAEFVPAITVAVYSAILPSTVHALTVFERWDDPAFAIKAELLRLYIMRVANIMVIALSYLQLLWSREYIPGLLVPEDTVHGCIEDQVGVGLLIFYLVEFVVQKLTSFLSIGVPALWMKFRQQRHHAEFPLPVQVIDLVYFETMMLFALPFYPYIAWVAPVLFFINFYWDKLMLLAFTRKPLRPWAEKDTGFYIVTFHVFALILGYSSLISFLYLAHKCGAHAGLLGIDPVTEWIASSWLNQVYTVIIDPRFLWSAIIALLTAYVFGQNTIAAVRMALERRTSKFDREVTNLQAAVDQRNRMIMHQRKLNALQSTTI